MTRQFRISMVLAAVAACIAIACMAPPVAQDPAYHAFVDGRPWLGVPNFGNVASNILFIIMGGLGIAALNQRHGGRTKAEYTVWRVFFTGAVLTGFGSGYYHLSPDSVTLVWDRLPMTLAFMSLTSLIVMERIDKKTGILLLPVLLAIGIASVWYWHYTESLGRGDLRPYALVQFAPIIVIGLILALFKTNDGSTGYLLCTLGWYVLAKVLEHYDAQIFAITGSAVSGHSLKHLAAAMGIWWMIKYARQP